MSHRNQPSQSSTGGFTYTTSIPTNLAPSKGTPAVLVKRGQILEKPINRIKGNEVSLNAFAFLFGELIHYTESRVSSIQDFERKLSDAGKRVGLRVTELLAGRGKGGLGNAKRQILAQDLLAYITTTLWTYMFCRPIDTFERSTEDLDEYMLSDNEPVLSQFISLPKESAQLNTNAFLAGVVEGVLVAGQFPCRVTAHSMPIPGFPQRTTILIKLHSSVLERENQLPGN